MQLPYKRFVKQVSNGGSFSRYGYIEMMQRNAKALETAQWHEARCSPDAVSLTVGQITRTDGVADEDSGEWTTPPSYTAWLNDRYDVFAQAGDGVQRMASMCGYAGCVAYRFTLPSENKSALESFSLAVQRDRYLRAGVRINIRASNDETPDAFTWAQIRGGSLHTQSTAAEAGTVGVSSWGFLGQPDTPYLLASRATEGTWAQGSAEEIYQMQIGVNEAYLWVFLTLEDPAAYWDMYSGKEMRYYYIEGSAKLVPSLCDFTFHTAGAQLPEENWFSSWSDLLPALPHLAAANFGDELANLSKMPCFTTITVPHVSIGGSEGYGTALSVLRETTSVAQYYPDGYGGTKSGSLPVEYLNAPGFVRNGSSLGLFILARYDNAASSGASVGKADSIIVANTLYTLSLGFTACIVPVGLDRYTRMKIISMVNVSVNNAMTREQGRGWKYAGLDVALNIWHSKSPFATGYAARQMASLLAAHPEFFTAASPRVQASYTFASATQTVEASLLKTIDCAGLGNTDDSSAPTEIEISVDVRPGEVIYIAPNIRQIFEQDQADPFKGIRFWGASVDSDAIDTSAENLNSFNFTSGDFGAKYRAPMSIAFA